MEHLWIETKILGGDDGAISGIAWPFGAPDRSGDLIEKGAFKAMKLPLPMLFGHDPNDPVGAWDVAEEKADGLHITGKLLVDDLPRAREVRALVKAGAVRGLSIGYIAGKSFMRPGGGRTIKELQVLEVSLVPIPMHPGSQVTSAKSAVEALRLAAALQRATAQLAAR